MKEKRLYVIVAISITGCGGGQLYIRNKALYMESLGWNVKILSFIPQNIYIKYFEKHRNDIDIRFTLPAYLYTKKQIKSILDSHFNWTDSYDECIVESTANFLSTWGEILAEKLHAKHWLYSLDEHSTDYIFFRDYLSFKFNRKEYATITADAVNRNLPFLKVEEPESYRLSAYCNNSIEDIEDNIECNLKAKVKIGILGRLNKDYVVPVSKDLAAYISSHPEITFDIVYIGYSHKKSDIKNVFRTYNGIPNVKIHITGYVCPVPLSFLKKFDFFIASAGSAWALCRNGLLVISVDGYHFKSNGILTLQTKNTLVPADTQYELSESLDDLILHKKFTTEQLTFTMPEDFAHYFVPHMEFIKTSMKEYPQIYYDMNRIKLPFYLKVFKYVSAIIGAKNIAKIKFLIR